MVGFEAWLIEALGMETLLLLLLLEETKGLAEVETKAEETVTVTEAAAEALGELRKKKAVNSRNNLAI